VNESKISYIAGVVGSDPILREGTRLGDLVSFRVGVTTGYPKDGNQYGETDWYDVVVKNAGLQATVFSEVYRGAKVMAQGNVQEKTDNTGRLQRSMWADRIGLVEYLRREQAPQPASIGNTAATPADELGF
jgi:single-stranded DNA-binding protein